MLPDVAGKEVTKMLDTIRKSLADFSAGRWDSVRKSLADDLVYEELATQTSCRRADEVVNALKRWKRAFPDLEANVLGGFESGDRVVAEVEWQGTQSGPLEGPFGTIQPSNKRGKTRGAIVATVKNGKIVQEHVYFDMLGVLSQIGIAPGLAAMPAASAKAGTEARPKH
jgi:steroid delta-isomerase-like uncharacterized protein